MLYLHFEKTLKGHHYGRKSTPRFLEVDKNDFFAQANFLWEDPSKYARL
jgi:hypothetical protein